MDIYKQFIVSYYCGVLEIVFEGFLFIFGEGGYYEIVRMVDEGEDEGGGDAAVDDDGVPVFFVHVVAGNDGVVFFAELEGEGGIAFYIDGEGDGIHGEEEKDFAHDFEDDGDVVEGEGFFYCGFGEAVVSDVFDVHGANLVFWWVEAVMWCGFLG